MIFSNIKQIVVPEGAVKKITYNGATLWERISRYLKTVIGKVVTVTDALNEPAESLVVTFNPKQDLNGYDKPWAGGSGKNLLDISELFAAPEDILYSGDTPYTFPHVLELALTPNTTYTVSSNYAIANKQRIVYVDTATAADAVYKANSVVKTTGNDGILKIGFFDNRTGSEDFLNKTVYLQVEKGSMATAYAPYENICPISGHMEVVTYDDPMYGGLVEFNQLVQNGDFSNGTSHWTNNFSTASVSDGVCELTLQAANGYLYQSVPQKVEGHKIYFVADASATASVSFGVLWGASMQSRIILSTTEQRVDFIATVGSGNTNLNLSFNGTSGSKIYLSNVQLFDLTLMFGEGNEPTTVDEFKALFPHDYYEYNTSETTCVSAVNGDEYHTYTTPFGRTVYGGEVEQVSGALTDKMAMVDLGTLKWYYFTRTNPPHFGADVSSMEPLTNNLLCSNYATVKNNPYTNAYGTIRATSEHSRNGIKISDAAYTDTNAFTAAMSGVQLCYELATPQTYQLDPQTISLLHGNNNVWSDGEVELTYWGTEQSN